MCNEMLACTSLDIWISQIKYACLQRKSEQSSFVIVPGKIDCKLIPDIVPTLLVLSWLMKVQFPFQASDLLRL